MFAEQATLGFLFPSVFVSLPIGAIKCSNKSKLREEGFILAHSSRHSPHHSEEAKAATGNIVAQSEAEQHLCKSLEFPFSTVQDPSQGMAPPTIKTGLPTSNSHRHVLRPIPQLFLNL